MKVEQHVISPLDQSFRVVVEHAQIEQQVDAELTKLAPKVKMDGFRVGQVPMSVLRQQYGDRVMSDALNTIVNSAKQEILETHKIVPALPPKVRLQGWKKGEDLIFDIEMSSMPEIRLPKFEELEIEIFDLDFDQSLIDQELTRLQNKKGEPKLVKSGRAVKKYDLVTLEFSGSLNGETFAGGQVKDYKVQLGFGTMLPDFEKQILGAKVNETKEFPLTFPLDYPDEKLAGQEAIFTATVSEIATVKPAELDDAFAKTLGAENVADLRNKIAAMFKQQYAPALEELQRRTTFDVLYEHITFDVPQLMVKNEFEALWQEILKAKEAGKLSAKEQKKSETQLKKAYEKASEKRVRLGLIISTIGREHSLAATNDETKEAIRQEIMRDPNRKDELVAFYQNNPQAVLRLQGPIVENKVVSFVNTLAQKTTVPISSKELQSRLEKLEVL